MPQENIWLDLEKYMSGIKLAKDALIKNYESLPNVEIRIANTEPAHKPVKAILAGWGNIDDGSFQWIQKDIATLTQEKGKDTLAIRLNTVKVGQHGEENYHSGEFLLLRLTDSEAEEAHFYVTNLSPNQVLLHEQNLTPIQFPFWKSHSGLPVGAGTYQPQQTKNILTLRKNNQDALYFLQNIL